MPRSLSLCALLLILVQTPSFAQMDSAARAYAKLRASYIIDLTYKINFAPFVLASANGFQLKSNYDIRVRPNEIGSIGLRVSHRWLSGALTFGIKNIQSEKKGTTDFLSLTINTYRPKWGFDGYFYSYKGEYISNKQIRELPQFMDSKTYPILPNVNTLYTGTNVYYIANHQKFSYRASFMCNEIQKKSAGSFLVMASYSHFSMNSDTGFVPGTIQPEIPLTSQIVNGKFNSFSIMPGYAYTLVFAKKYYLTLAPSLGLMTQLQDYTTQENSHKDWQVIYPRAMMRTAIGYNGSKFYYGLSAIVDNYIIQLPQKDHLIYNIGNANIYVGFRVNVPKRFRKFSKTIGEYAPEKMLNDLTR
jgi:hypothetical protein